MYGGRRILARIAHIVNEFDVEGHFCHRWLIVAELRGSAKTLKKGFPNPYFDHALTIMDYHVRLVFTRIDSLEVCFAFLGMFF